MNITYSSTDGQEPLVLFNSLLELTKVIIENTRAVVSSSFISALARSLTSESKNIVVLKAFTSSDSIVRICVRHRETSIIIHQILFKGFILLNQSLLTDNIFLPLWSVEVNWEFDTLRLVDSQWQITFFL
jgi:hypothetical protein